MGMYPRPKRSRPSIPGPAVGATCMTGREGGSTATAFFFGPISVTDPGTATTRGIMGPRTRYAGRVDEPGAQMGFGRIRSGPTRPGCAKAAGAETGRGAGGRPGIAVPMTALARRNSATILSAARIAESRDPARATGSDCVADRTTWKLTICWKFAAPVMILWYTAFAAALESNFGGGGTVPPLPSIDSGTVHGGLGLGDRLDGEFVAVLRGRRRHHRVDPVQEVVKRTPL